MAACSSFGGSDDTPQTDPDAGGDVDAIDAENDGRDPITGEPADDSFIVTASPATLQVVQGSSVKITLSVKRGKQVTGPIAIALKGLPDGLAAAPITIVGDSGDLEFVAAATGAQGAASLTVEASSPTSTSPVTLTISALVRGTPGSIDTTWTQSSPIGSPSNLLVAGDDTVYAVSSCFDTADGTTPNVCVEHFDANGKRDVLYGVNGVARLVRKDPQDAALQADGTLVVVGGGAIAVISTTWIARLTPKGAPDTNFATTGALTLTAPPNAAFAGEVAGAFAVALAADGSVFLGYDNHDNAQSKHYNAITKFDAQGVAVPAFGGAGTIRSSTTTGRGMALRPTGSPPGLVILSMLPSPGFPGVVDFIEVNSTTGVAYSQYPLGGPSTIPLAGAKGTGEAPRFVQLPDGSTVAPFEADGGLFLVKFDAQGARAGGFGTNGVVGPFPVEVTNLIDPGAPAGIAIQSDGKFIVSLMNGVFTRFTTGGTLDGDFGSGGSVSTARPSASATWQQRVAVQKSGRIVVSGASQLLGYWP